MSTCSEHAWSLTACYGDQGFYSTGNNTTVLIGVTHAFLRLTTASFMNEVSVS